MQYSEQLSNFKNSIEIAKKIHISLGVATNLPPRYKIGREVFFRLIGQCQSILKLLPVVENDLTTEINQYDDLASILSLVRNFTETYQTFYYSSIDNIDHEEVELRNLLLHLHMASELVEIAQNFGNDPNEVESYKQRRRDLREEVKNNAYYLKLDESGEANIYEFIKENNDNFYRKLKSKKGRCLNSKSINRKIINDFLGDVPLKDIVSNVQDSSQVDRELLVKRFEGLDTQFSNHTHTSPLSLAEMIYETQIGDKSKHFYSLGIRHTMFYLGMAMCNIVELFKEYDVDINEQDKIFIASNMFQYIQDLQVIR